MLTESEAAVAHRCESGETTACAKAALAAMNAFDDYDAAGALRSGCLGGDVSQCWIACVLTEDSHGLDPAGTLVAEACARGESSACAAADWLKRPTTLLDAAARALPSDAVSSMSGLMLKAFPAGEPLRLNERVLVREINYGDGSLPPEVTTRRLRVGSMAGDQVRFAGRSGRVVTWHTIDGTLYVREQQVLGVLTHGRRRFILHRRSCPGTSEQTRCEARDVASVRCEDLTWNGALFLLSALRSAPCEVGVGDERRLHRDDT